MSGTTLYSPPPVQPQVDASVDVRSQVPSVLQLPPDHDHPSLAVTVCFHVPVVTQPFEDTGR